MSNNHNAVLGAAPAATAVRGVSNNKASFWRRMFDAWVQSYANRITADGKVLCEL